MDLPAAGKAEGLEVIELRARKCAIAGAPLDASAIFLEIFSPLLPVQNAAGTSPTVIAKQLG